MKMARMLSRETVPILPSFWMERHFEFGMNSCMAQPQNLQELPKHLLQSNESSASYSLNVEKQYQISQTSIKYQFLFLT